MRKELSKVDQRHRASQLRKLRKHKKEAVLAEKRQLGGKDGPRHQVLVVPLRDKISLPEAFGCFRIQYT